MDTLFPVDPVYPEGFVYKADFLTKEEEDGLLALVKEYELHNFNFHGYTANRKVLSFGYDYSFDNGSLSKSQEIPKEFAALLTKASEATGIAVQDFEELLIIEYPPGAVMNWHRDAPPFDVVVGISLAADCAFKFRPAEKTKQGRSSIITVPLKRRSLYVMKDIVRNDWQHSVAPVKETRYSITLRTLRQKADD